MSTSVMVVLYKHIFQDFLNYLYVSFIKSASDLPYLYKSTFLGCFEPPLNPLSLILRLSSGPENYAEWKRSVDDEGTKGQK